LIRHPLIIAPIGAQRQALLTERLRYTCPDQPRGLEDAGAFLQPGADLLDFVP
jgi:hypothetical protein